MNGERVVVYLDASDKWRWRWYRGSDIVADSSQGYVEKRDCILGLTSHSRTTYQLTYESRNTPNKRAYQQGRLIFGDKTEILVEVVPWTASDVQWKEQPDVPDIGDRLP